MVEDENIKKITINIKFFVKKQFQIKWLKKKKIKAFMLFEPNCFCES